MKVKTWNILLSWLGISLLAFSYNNCGMQNNSDSTAALNPNSSLTFNTGDLCEDELLKLFSSGFHGFLKENCSTCHSSGPGKGRFANADAKIALQDFNQIGPTKISTNATSNTHNPPYTGPQHIQRVNDLKLEWQLGQEDYAKCKGAPTVVTVPLEERITFELKAQTVPAMEFGEEKEISWVVNQDLFRIRGTGPNPDLPGANFSLKIGKHKTGGGDEYYSVRAPTIYGSEVDVHVTGLHIKINGMLLKIPTTFKFVDKDIRAGSEDDLSGLLSTGALVIPGITSSADNISVVIEDIKAVVLPPPQPPAQVNFSGALVEAVPVSGDRVVNLEVVLSQAPVDPVSLAIEEDSSSLCDSADPVDLAVKAECLPAVADFICPAADTTCKAGLKLSRARSVVGTSYNRFDWDFKFKSTTTLIFLPGETKKIVQIQFSKDIRKEDNRLLTLRLEAALGGIILGSNATKYFVINKINNPVPPVGVARFQDLMRPLTGILAVNCMECHNSTKREGQYDMSNYDEMVERGVLVPGSTSSKMFRRINPTDPDWVNLQPMPRTGAMEDVYIREVQKWIEAGALNN